MFGSCCIVSPHNLALGDRMRSFSDDFLDMVTDHAIGWTIKYPMKPLMSLYSTTSILSDHSPVAATIKTTNLSQIFTYDDMRKHEKNATQQQKLRYQMSSMRWFSQIPVPNELIQCDNKMCNNQNNINKFNQSYSNIIVTQNGSRWNCI